MEVFWTVVSGVLVFVCGQFIVRLVLDPIVAFKEQLGELTDFLIDNGPSFKGEWADVELAEQVRDHSVRLLSKRQAVPYFKGWRWLGLPSEKEVTEAAIALRSLSRCVRPTPSDQDSTRPTMSEPGESWDQWLRVGSLLGLDLDVRRGQ